MTADLHKIDQASLEQYLNEHIVGFGRLKSIQQFADGQSNPTYRLETDEAFYALRAKPPGKLLKSAHQVDREFRVMAALSHTDVGVPRMFHLSTDDSPIGAMFFVMEYVAGRVFWNPALPGFQAKERTEIYDSMNRTLAALHNVDPEVVGLKDFGRPGNYFARQVDRWTRQYKASELEPLPDMDWLCAWLADNMVEDSGEVSIVHGDYRLDNMIFEPDQPEIAALIDWELSTLGYPLADLGYQCMQWRMPNAADAMIGLGGLERSELGIPTEQEYVERYCERRELEKIENWNFYIVFSYFRLVAILQGVVRRAVDGNASNPHSVKTMRKAIPMLARDARQILIS